MKKIILTALVGALILLQTSCNIDPQSDSEYMLTIQGSSIEPNNLNGNVTGYFIVRNDGSHDYASIDFSMRFSAGSSSDQLTVQWNGGGDLLQPGESINVSIPITDGDLLNSSIATLSSIRVIDADLYNINESSDLLYTFEFEGNSAIVWSDQ